MPTSPSPAEEVTVSTVAAAAAGTGHHMLKVEGYSHLKAMHGGKTGSYVESAAFNVAGHGWRIRCYLNGISKEREGFVSLYLVYLGDAAAAAAAGGGSGVVHAECEFALVPHEQQGTPPAERTAAAGVRPFGVNNHWGFQRLISVEDLERSGFLRDDCFAVRCRVTVVQARTVAEKAAPPQDLARMGMLCKCDDHRCKRHHARPATETFLERFANFCCSFCDGRDVHSRDPQHFVYR